MHLSKAILIQPVLSFAAATPTTKRSDYPPTCDAVFANGRYGFTVRGRGTLVGRQGLRVKEGVDSCHNPRTGDKPSLFYTGAVGLWSITGSVREKTGPGEHQNGKHCIETAIQKARWRDAIVPTDWNTFCDDKEPEKEKYGEDDEDG